jgi:hypothetical protein
MITGGNGADFFHGGRRPWDRARRHSTFRNET